MKIIIFSLVFMILIASVSLAQGLKITRIDAHVDYEDAYVYRIEQEQKKQDIRMGKFLIEQCQII